MDILNIQKDYSFVLKVLESCTKLEHLEASQKLFDNFIYKWISDLSEERTLKFNWNFQKNKSQKIRQLRK